MPPGGDYERLPMYASSPTSPRLRFHRNSITSSIQPSLIARLNPLPNSRPGSPKRHPVITSSRRRRICGLCILPARLLRFTAWPSILLKYILPTTTILLFLLLFLYEPHIELSLYSRNWIGKELKSVVEPLGGCFVPDRVSRRYNVSEHVYGTRRTEVQAGFSLKMGMDCYNFAGTIQKRLTPGSPWLSSSFDMGRGQQPERTLFHTYWRVDLAPFGKRQEWLLKSFFATQDLDATQLVLWTNGDLSHSDILRDYLGRYPDSFAVKIVNILQLARGTELEGNEMLNMHDGRAWLDSDLIRLLLLWNYGGVWVDMDSLFTRDLEPLLEHEFVTQWDCYDKPYTPFNGALMRFRQHSPYLCEAFHIIATSPPPRRRSTDWGSVLYLKLWRRLVANAIPPFKILPFCFNDGRSCRLDNRLPDPFKPDRKDGLWTAGLGLEEGGGLDRVLKQQVFGVHLHNQWDKDFPKGGWVERLLLRKYDEALRRLDNDGPVYRAARQRFHVRDEKTESDHISSETGGITRDEGDSAQTEDVIE